MPTLPTAHCVIRACTRPHSPPACNPAHSQVAVAACSCGWAADAPHHHQGPRMGEPIHAHVHPQLNCKMLGGPLALHAHPSIGCSSPHFTGRMRQSFARACMGTALCLHMPSWICHALMAFAQPRLSMRLAGGRSAAARWPLFRLLSYPRCSLCLPALPALTLVPCAACIFVRGEAGRSRACMRADPDGLKERDDLLCMAGICTYSWLLVLCGALAC